MSALDFPATSVDDPKMEASAMGPDEPESRYYIHMISKNTFVAVIGKTNAYTRLSSMLQTILIVSPWPNTSITLGAAVELY